MKTVTITWNKDNDPAQPRWQVRLDRRDVANYLFSILAACAIDYHLVVTKKDSDQAYAGFTREVFERWMLDHPSDRYMDASYEVVVDSDDKQLIHFKLH